MIKEQALELAKKHGVQFNISTNQYMISLLIFYTMLFFKINLLFSSTILIIMMSYGAWDASPTVIGKSASKRHLIFRFILTIAMWVICYTAISIINLIMEN